MSGPIDRDALLTKLYEYADVCGVGEDDPTPGFVSDILALVQPDPRIDAVRALHVLVESEIDWTGQIVAGCTTCGEGWPCATIRALDGTP